MGGGLRVEPGGFSSVRLRRYDMSDGSKEYIMNRLMRLAN